MSKDRSMADVILANARRIGLAAYVDAPTPGDGNCFYHSVLQQLACPDVIYTCNEIHIRVITLNTQGYGIMYI